LEIVFSKTGGFPLDNGQKKDSIGSLQNSISGRSKKEEDQLNNHNQSPLGSAVEAKRESKIMGENRPAE
jgi:hypothetical protein